MQMSNNEATHNLIKQQLFADPDFIKKSKINYFSCDCKGLHEGEKLVLVCIQPDCKNKGLICPVCKEENHKDHEAVHLKVFLGELQAKLIKRPTDQQEVQIPVEKIGAKTISDHLTELESAKKSIINNLQECVKTLAQAIKDIQKKIQDEYLRIRRIILSQKSFQGRLPKIYNILIAEGITDENAKAEVKEQIKKLTELLHKANKKDQMKVADNVDKVVELYVQNSHTCTTHLLGFMTDLPKKISDLPIKLKSISEEGQGEGKQSVKNISYTFSQNNKANSLLLGEDKKSVSILGPQQMGGLLFVDGDDSQNTVRKINFKMTSSVSDSISIGVGDVEKMKLTGFTVQQMENDGLFGICAMGINITDIESPTFVFSQGDIIEVTFQVNAQKITFRRRNGVEKEELQVALPIEQGRKLKFFVSLVLYGDGVEIVE